MHKRRNDHACLAKAIQLGGGSERDETYSCLLGINQHNWDHVLMIVSRTRSDVMAQAYKYKLTQIPVDGYAYSQQDEQKESLSFIRATPARLMGQYKYRVNRGQQRIML